VVYLTPGTQVNESPGRQDGSAELQGRRASMERLQRNPRRITSADGKSEVWHVKPAISPGAKAANIRKRTWAINRWKLLWSKWN